MSLFGKLPSDNMNTNKPCSIFFYDDWLSASPSTINLAKVLAQNGYIVTIYTVKSNYPRIEQLPTGIFVLYINPSISLKFSQIFYQNNLGLLVRVIELILFTFQILAHKIKQGFVGCKSEISIGIDSRGSILAFAESFFFKSNLVYFSLELRNQKNTKFDRIGRILERFIYKKMDCILIQDEARFRHLSEYHEYHHKQVFYIPNSVNSKSLTSGGNLSCNYFVEKFNLNRQEDHCLVIQAGMVNDDVFCSTLAYAFKSIKQKNVSLVFHERKKRQLDDPYIVSLRNINSQNLFLSLDPLPLEEIYKVFSSITIGLAFYKDIDANNSEIAKASGKLSGYLEYGKPVLMNDLQSLAELNNKYQFGIVIRDPSNSLEIEQALEKILNNYEFYSKNALDCFKEEFDFYTKTKPFINFLLNRLS
ncbi:MAG: hypothetical protein HWQ41_06485 [Nostoc sp. NOS(2021)]|uniref:hypothetical protein n=1 Tax=Nostoc sp. NOS(2021) TaxID=2815407 RepID=UPI0025F5A379|nr:hypothetical protein [Nostoc sp. NOS(2021)]MBN3894911.1 hypothetical protein [Nostoc sp. NOS(2021)]